MPKKTVSVEVESSGYDLIVALTGVVLAAKASGAAGALESAVAHVVTIVGSIESIPADVREDVWALEKGALLGVSDLIKALVTPAVAMS